MLSEPRGFDFGNKLEIPDETLSHLDGAFARMGIGAVGASGPNLELEPEWSLLAKAHCVGAARFAIKDAVA